MSAGQPVQVLDIGLMVVAWVAGMELNTYRLQSVTGAIPLVRHGRSGIGRRRMSRQILRGRRAVRPARRSSNSTTTEQFLVTSGLLLLQSGSSSLDQSAFDAPSGFWRENGPGIQGPWHRLFPCLEHLVQFSASLRVDESVGIHEGLIHIAAQEQSVGSPDILHY